MAHLVLLIAFNSSQTVTESRKLRSNLPLYFSESTAHLETKRWAFSAPDVTHWRLTNVGTPASRPIWTRGDNSRVDDYVRRPRYSSPTMLFLIGLC